MVTPVIMPKLGETMEEGKVVGWRRGEGDSVTKGDILFEVSTDKANFEVEAPASGVLLRILRPAGEEMVPVTSTIAWIGDSRDEKAPDAGASSTASPSGKAASMAAPTPKAMAPVPEGEGLKASPYARKLAAGKGVDITKITGTGPGGRIVEQDVLAAAGSGSGAAAGMHPFEAEFALLEDLGVQMILREIDQKDVVLALHGAGRATVDIIFRNVSTRARKMIEEDLAALGSVRADSVEKARDTFLRVIRFLEERGELVIRRGPGMVAPLAGIRKVAAERLTKAWREIPHFQLVRDIRMERCAALKKAAEGKGGKASYNAMVIKAVGVALREHPEFNAHYLPEGIRTLTEVNVGMAVGIKDGLVVPVVRDADKRSLAEVSLEASALMKKAVAGKLSLAEMSGGGFTVTNLGMHGIDSFTAIINPPQVGILAVGKVREAPVVEDGKVVPGLVMTVTLSADHRAVDGLRGALFLETVRKVLEEGLDEAP